MCCPTFSSSSGFRATRKPNNQTVTAAAVAAALCTAAAWAGGEISFTAKPEEAHRRTKDTAAAASSFCVTMLTELRS